MHRSIHPSIYPPIHPYIHTYVHTCLDVCVYMHTYPHIRMLVRMHAHVHADSWHCVIVGLDFLEGKWPGNTFLLIRHPTAWTKETMCCRCLWSDGLGKRFALFQNSLDICPGRGELKNFLWSAIWYMAQFPRKLLIPKITSWAQFVFDFAYLNFHIQSAATV